MKVKEIKNTIYIIRINMHRKDNIELVILLKLRVIRLLVSICDGSKEKYSSMQRNSSKS